MEAYKPKLLDPKGRWWEPTDHPAELVEYGFWNMGDFVHPTDYHVGLCWIGIALINIDMRPVKFTGYGIIYKVGYFRVREYASLPAPGLAWVCGREEYVKRYNRQILTLVAFIKEHYPENEVMVQIWNIKDRDDLQTCPNVWPSVTMEPTVTESNVSVAAYPIGATEERIKAKQPRPKPKPKPKPASHISTEPPPIPKRSFVGKWKHRWKQFKRPPDYFEESWIFWFRPLGGVVCLVGRTAEFFRGERDWVPDKD